MAVVTITAEHCSGLHSVPPAKLKGALVKQLADLPDVFSLTEMMSEARAGVLDDFSEWYAVARVRGTGGRDECAALIRRDRFRALRVPRAVRLSDLPIPRRSGAFDWALVVVLEDVRTGERHTRIIVHRPSGVEGADGWRDTAQRRVYADGTRGLVRLVASIDGPLVITGDHNIDLRKAWVLRYLRLVFPDFTPTWSADDLPAPGTHGGRVIDFSLVRGFDVVSGEVVSAHGSSDHRGIRETHRPKEAPVPTTPKTDALVAALRRRGVEVLTHEQWGSLRRSLYIQRLRTHPHALLPAKAVDTLWNHVTVTNDDGPLLGDFRADMREVERIGFQRFGSGFSYNIGVDRNADRPRLAIGQYLEAKGTHTVNDKSTPGYSHNQNKVALAVAWVGVPGNTLNKHAITAMVQLRAALIEVGALTDHYDDVPHSLVAAKDCPTDELRDRLPELKRLALAAVKPAPRPAPAPVRTPRWDEIWDTANEIADRNAVGTPDGDAARTIRTLAARFSTAH